MLRLLLLAAALQLTRVVGGTMNLLTAIPFHTLSRQGLRTKQLPVLSFKPPCILGTVVESGDVEDVGARSSAHGRDDGGRGREVDRAAVYGLRERAVGCDAAVHVRGILGATQYARAAGDVIAVVGVITVNHHGRFVLDFDDFIRQWDTRIVVNTFVVARRHCFLRSI